MQLRFYIYTDSSFHSTLNSKLFLAIIYRCLRTSSVYTFVFYNRTQVKLLELKISFCPYIIYNFSATAALLKNRVYESSYAQVIFSASLSFVSKFQISLYAAYNVYHQNSNYSNFKRISSKLLDESSRWFEMNYL